MPSPYPNRQRNGAQTSDSVGSNPTGGTSHEVLSLRRLNRATLARQYLLERASVRAIDAIEHLAGLQSQAPLAPYVGLWTRLRDFTPDELSTLTEDRRVVRLHLMRNTVHLVSARDCLDWRALFYPLHSAEFSAHFRRGIEGVDRDALLNEARRLLEERPRTRAELGKALAHRWPRADPSALAYAVTHHIALCQVPPRGVWGKTGPSAWSPVESWLGAPLRSAPVDSLVLRYLGAFGPATVSDMQMWSGLTRLAEVVERLPLRTFRGEAGQTLYDLPDAPRPAEDVPAPPRFLPEYDNLLLSHKDRSRVIVDHRAVPLPPGTGARSGTFLVDGVWQGTWQIRDRTLRIQPFATLRHADREALLGEAVQLCAFVAPQAKHDVVLHQPH
jgi:Winged helix DNA-binding domain